ncbi:MAG TPA: hypothetical protein PKE07_13720 [Lacibacter sp.]|nr:hypothetical protein [Lacibacter sp.]HMO88550.1 hypothetical protein [Lacibacter sp.]
MKYSIFCLLFIWVMNAYSQTGALTGTRVRQINVSPNENFILGGLCPIGNSKGDAEFDGNGPHIKCDVRIRIGRDSASLLADIYFWAQETKSDWSTTEGRWSRKIYTAPRGTKILKIVGDSYSFTELVCCKSKNDLFRIDRDTGVAVVRFMKGMPDRDVLSKHGATRLTAPPINNFMLLNTIQFYATTGNNTCIRVPAKNGLLVKYFHFVGDTGGSDISNDDNCNDDTRIVNLEFFPIRLEVRN